MFPVPIVAGFVGAGVVDLVLPELQIFANVLLKAAVKGPVMEVS
jgi:hypothetical protein